MQRRLDQDLVERRASCRRERRGHAVRLHRPAGPRRQDERPVGSTFPPVAHQSAEMSSLAAEGRSYLNLLPDRCLRAKANLAAARRLRFPIWLAGVQHRYSEALGVSLLFRVTRLAHPGANRLAPRPLRKGGHRLFIWLPSNPLSLHTSILALGAPPK